MIPAPPGGPTVRPAPAPAGEGRVPDGTAPDDRRALDDGTVIGDGTTGRSRARSRWRRWRWPLLLVVVVLLVAAITVTVRPATSADPFAPDNPSELGARALAQVLADQGVDVSYVRTTREAVANAVPGSTLLVAGTWYLTDEQVDEIAGTGADLVVAEPEWSHLDALTDGKLDLGSTTDDAPRDAACTDPDARAAGTIRSNGYGLTALDPDVVVCFPTPGEAGAGSYATLRADDRRVVVVDDLGLLSNERLPRDGTAALMLRTLGQHEQLTWYLPSLTDTGTAAPGPGVILPAWTGPVAVQLLLVVLALALWRGRGLGRVVGEPLPVTVRAAETTLGRGRLYRRSRSRGHAAAALRAGTAMRTATQLGLPRSAGARDVIDALSRATGRSTEQVAGLLYGPPPNDDAGLLQLARQLDEIESEVHRT